MMNSENLITVLMSSYNGERYIREQIDSILHQQEVNIKLFVRDDGSTDGTLQILQEYQEAGLLNFYTGKNLKPARSFMQLLKDAPQADYYAFSDQDDYWKPTKLNQAIKRLKLSTNTPALYFCQTQLADKDLKLLPSIEIHPLLTFGEALIYQFIGGCTIVINQLLRDIIIRYQPQYLPMHDVWLYDVAQAVGADIYFDAIPQILYRQHDKNVIGQGYNALTEWKRRLRRLTQCEHLRSRMAQEILRGYSENMTKENRIIAGKIAKQDRNIKERLSVAFDKHYMASDWRTYIRFQICNFLNLV